MAPNRSRPTKGLLARKVGMTQLFNADGTVSAVTVLEAGPCRVLGLRTVETDGYAAAQLAFGAIAERKVTKPVAGVFKKAGFDALKHIVEIRNYEGLEVGQELKADLFAEGDLVDVTSTSITMLSPGRHISTPSGSLTEPVTSVVRM